MTPSDNPLLPRSLRVATAPVFHYTSAAGLLGVVESGLLRASHAAGLNDLAEVRQGWTAVSKWLAVAPRSRAVEYLERLAEDPPEAHGVFVLSGSTAKDDANQWRLYADGARGYAIELDPGVALAVVSPISPPLGARQPRGPFTTVSEIASVSPWRHVLYSEADVATAMQELVETLNIEIPKLDDIDDPDAAEHEADVLRNDAYEALATIAHLIKQPGFSGEHEVRVVTTLLWNQKHVGYRAGAYGIVGHVFLAPATAGLTTDRVLYPGEHDELPLKSVRTGPLLRKEHRLTVRAFLQQHGYRSPSVRRSKVPLR